MNFRRALIVACCSVSFVACLPQLENAVKGALVDIPWNKPTTVPVLQENVQSAGAALAKTYNLGEDKDFAERKGQIKECEVDLMTYKLKDVVVSDQAEVVIGGSIYLNACSDGTAGDQEGAEVAGDPLLLAEIPEGAAKNMAEAVSLKLETTGIEAVKTVFKNAGKLTLCTEYYVISDKVEVKSVAANMEFELSGGCKAQVSK